MEENKALLKQEKKDQKHEKKYRKLENKEALKNQKLEQDLKDNEVRAIEKENKRIEREPIKQKHRMLNEAPYRSPLEEIGNAITHGVGAVLAAIGLVLLLQKSDTPLKITASLVYGISLFFMMSMSCLYHSWKSGMRVKRLWRRFDYSSIYLLIGGTFAPLLLVYWGDTLGIVFFIIQWVAIVTGITFVAVFGPGRLRWLHYPLYFIIGWSGIIFIPDMISRNLNMFWLILLGGVVYSLGMIPFALKKVKSAHFIWHFFVLAGAIVHFIAILLFVY